MNSGTGGVKGRRVLVTGASRGIGLATARLLRQRGAVVTGVSRTLPPQLSSSAKNNKNTSDEDLPIFHHYVVADLSTPEGAAAAVVEAAARNDDRIDILVVNHGFGSAEETSLEKTDVEVFQRSMATNVEGPFYLTRLVLPYMIRHGYGRCVYVSSTAATTEGAERHSVGYNTSKSALLGLMHSVCQDGAEHGITANAVLPGWVQTEMAERSAAAEAHARGCSVEDIWTERAAIYPAKRVVAPEEVAHAIVFLASEESSGISGESIRVALGCPI